MKPSWCAKPSPCDYDKGSSYCPHRECRIALEATLSEAQEALHYANGTAELAIKHRDEAESSLGELQTAVREYLAAQATDTGASYDDIVRLNRLSAVANQRCINFPCALPSGHSGPCSSSV